MESIETAPSRIITPFTKWTFDKMKRTAFHDRVADEAVGKADEEFIRFVRKFDQLQAWRQALIELKTDVEQQISEKNAALDREHTKCLSKGEEGKRLWFQAKDDYQRWKVSATRFKGAIEHRLGEIKALRKLSEDDRGSDRMMLLNWAASLIPDEEDGAKWHRAFEEMKGNT